MILDFEVGHLSGPSLEFGDAALYCRDGITKVRMNKIHSRWTIVLKLTVR
jgi:hypothetical protein